MTVRVLEVPENAGPAGLYIHVPFCLGKCPYCNFFSVTDLSLKGAYLDALLGEIELYRNNRLRFDSVYFGGGTPSLLSPHETARILKRVRESLFVSEDVEITLEANPGTVSEGSFRGYFEAGINRINIGVQSFRDENLRFLGRIHSSREARAAVESVREAGFENMGLDLIYGLPGQTRKEWEEDLSLALSLRPEHLSCYMLTYEGDAPMGKAAKNGDIVPLRDDAAARLFSFTLNYLSDFGYPPYEISNFARTDSADPEKFRSRHNVKYWNFSPYVGLGPSAHSYLHPVRQWNTASVAAYIYKVGAGKSPAEESETLSVEQQMIESVFLGLRTTDGIDSNEFEKRFGAPFAEIFQKPLARLIKEGLLTVTGGRCAPTLKGMRFHDGICGLLVQAVATIPLFGRIVAEFPL